MSQAHHLFELVLIVNMSQNFLPRLKDHLITRILGHALGNDEAPEYSDEDRDNIVIVNNLMFEHNVLWVNYTTYDLRHEQDSINPHMRPDIMMISHETNELRHPYWYAQVIRIFHVNVRYFGPGSTSHEAKWMNDLFVQWFGRCINSPAGFIAHRLHHIGFVEEGDPDVFGFIDPDVVLRGIHLIPSFVHGHTSEYLGPSFVHPDADCNEDWRYYQVNMWVVSFTY